MDEDIQVTGDVGDQPDSHPDPIISLPPVERPLKRIRLGVVGESNSIAFIPPAVKAMCSIQPYKSPSAFPRVLVFNDSFHNMLDYKTKYNNFPSTYNEMVSFLNEVHLLLYSYSITLAFRYSQIV